jgi:hypothetical protein
MEKENKEKNEEIYARLTADFPSEAYTADTSRGFELTSLKAQYVVDRLNQVFGIFGWDYKTNILENNEKGVLLEGILTVQMDGLARLVKNFGSSAHKKLMADGYKGASTDALGKCASMLGIGDQVFKGNIKAGGTNNAPVKHPQNNQKTPINNNAQNLKGLVPSGKYAGKKFDDVFKNDKQYIEWAASPANKSAKLRDFVIEEMAKGKSNKTIDSNDIPF